MRWLGVVGWEVWVQCCGVGGGCGQWSESPLVTTTRYVELTKLISRQICKSKLKYEGKTKQVTTRSSENPMFSSKIRQTRISTKQNWGNQILWPRPRLNHSKIKNKTAEQSRREAPWPFNVKPAFRIDTHIWCSTGKVRISETPGCLDGLWYNVFMHVQGNRRSLVHGECKGKIAWCQMVMCAAWECSARCGRGGKSAVAASCDALLFVCRLMKPDNLYFASHPGREVQPLGVHPPAGYTELLGKLVERLP